MHLQIPKEESVYGRPRTGKARTEEHLIRVPEVVAQMFLFTKT